MVQKKSYAAGISIVGGLFFVLGFITWLNATLVPYLKVACELSNFEAYFVTAAFYGAYVAMLLPAAQVLQRSGLKNGLTIGLMSLLAGVLIFIPAAQLRSYPLFLIGLLAMGAGLALLQAAATPYVAALGRPERTARRMGLMGVCGKVAGILSPLVVGSVLFREMDNLEASIQLAEGVSRAAELDTLAHKAVLPYLVIMLALAALAVVVRFSPLPNVNAEGRRQAAGVRRRKLLRFPRFWFGLLALALCVGVEVVAVDTIVLYGKSVGLSFQVAKAFPAYPLLAMALGYLLGAAATPRYVSQEQAPALCALSGIVFSLLAINTGGGLSIAFISLLGLSNALLWPTIFSLSLRGLGKLTQLGAAILATATVGGAVVPLAYGHLADSVGNRQAYWLLVPCYVLILLFAIMSSGKERQQGQKGD